MPIDDILRCHILKCRPIDLAINRPLLTTTQQYQLEQYQIRLKNGEPLQYILGEWDFMGLTFKLNASVLIPRPETEQMVEKAITQLKNFNKLNILDLGTGSGCIAVTLAKHIPQAFIYAVDISVDAVEVAKANAIKHGVQDRINFILADMKKLGTEPSFLKESGSVPSFELVISNPPYIPSKEIAGLPVDVQHEPRLALDGGEDGFDFYRDLIKITPDLLTKNGCLMMEFGDGQAEDLRRLLMERFSIIKIYQDLAGRDRFVVASI